MYQSESTLLNSSSNLVSWRKSSLIGKLVGVISPWRSGSYLLNYAEYLKVI